MFVTDKSFITHGVEHPISVTGKDYCESFSFWGRLQCEHLYIFQTLVFLIISLVLISLIIFAAKRIKKNEIKLKRLVISLKGLRRINNLLILIVFLLFLIVLRLYW